MVEMDLGKGDMPKVGDPFAMPVIPAATRTTLFPDQAVILTTRQGTVEVVLLRQEAVVVQQSGVVADAHDGDFSVNFTDTAVVPQLQDIGHFRLPSAAGVDLAVNLLVHLFQFHGIERDAVMARLDQQQSTPI